MKDTQIDEKVEIGFRGAEKGKKERKGKKDDFPQHRDLESEWRRGDDV